MAKWYDSFLLRRWHLDDDGQRFEIEHIQSGARTRVASLAAALAWIGNRDRPAGADEALAARPTDEPEQ